ncbi:MAG: branched-chain amino acid ABC transporter permease [Erysipelotrichaceae bacterium]|nr:branched-chain amino acid ABC transporter permease [Erysipelotrichaceae bacterium]
MMKNFFSKLFDQKLRSRTISYLLVIIAFIILQLMSSTGSLSSLLKSLLVPVCCYTVAAIGLNLNVGFSGELNLGQAGFMSVGAFTGICVSGILASTIANPVLRLIIAIIAGALIAAIMGYIIGIPVLKLQGDYLAIVTLAFGQIIKSLITNMYLGFDESGLHVSFVENKVTLAPGGKMLLTGPMGATGTQRIASFAVGVILILCALTIVYNLIYSKSGRAIMGCRDNRIAAESIGINVANTKMLAFIISASLAGAAGALYGLNYSTLVPNKFDFNTSILILVFVVLGGLGNMTGTIISTTVLMLLPELLRSLQDYRMLIYAIVLIVIMLVTNNAFLQAKASKLRESLIKGKKGAKLS